MTEFTDS